MQVIFYFDNMENQTTSDEVVTTTNFNKTKFKVSNNKFKSGKLYKTSRRKNNTWQCIGIGSTAILSGLVISLVIFGKNYITGEFVPTILSVVMFAILSAPLSLGLTWLLFKIFNPNENIGDDTEHIYLEGYINGYNDTIKSERNPIESGEEKDSDTFI